MSILEVVQGSYGGKVTVGIESSGTLLDLSNFSVYARLTPATSTDALWERECTVITPPEDGVVEYTWQENDLDVPGLYKMEIEVRSSDNLVRVTSPEVIDIQIMQRMVVPT